MCFHCFFGVRTAWMCVHVYWCSVEICDSYTERGNKQDERVARGLFVFQFCELERTKDNNKSLHYVIAWTTSIISSVVSVQRNLQGRICNLLPAHHINQRLSQWKKESKQFPKTTFGHNIDRMFRNLLLGALNLFGKQSARSSQYFSLKHSRKWTNFIIIIGGNNWWAHVSKI